MANIPFTLWLWHSQFAMERSTMLLIGQPSISIRVIEKPWRTVSHNQRVNSNWTWFTEIVKVGSLITWKKRRIFTWNPTVGPYPVVKSSSEPYFWTCAWSAKMLWPFDQEWILMSNVSYILISLKTVYISFFALKKNKKKTPSHLQGPCWDRVQEPTEPRAHRRCTTSRASQQWTSAPRFRWVPRYHHWVGKTTSGITR